MKRTTHALGGLVQRWPLYSSLAIASIGLGSGAIAQLPAAPIFERIAISPSFDPDPLILRGISGGSIPAAQAAGVPETPTGFCTGFVDRQPDHRVTLNQPFSYLSLQIRSLQDTMLVVRGPGGTWCNDDQNGKNPGISGQWLAGTYEVWVGSFQQNEYHPYTLNITEVR